MEIKNQFLNSMKNRKIKKKEKRGRKISIVCLCVLIIKRQRSEIKYERKLK